MMSWWAMHGYACYIWPAYGVVALVLVGNAWRAHWYSRSVKNHLKQWVNKQ